MIRLFSCTLFVFLLFQLGAQQLQLPLDPGRISVGFNFIQSEDGSFVFANSVAGPNLFSGVELNLTRLDIGEGVRWSKDYNLGVLLTQGQVVAWPEENAFLLAATALDSNLNKILVKVDDNGDPLWGRRFGDSNDVFFANLGKTDVLPLDDGTVLLAGGADNVINDTGRSDLYAARIDADGNLIWGKGYCFSCLGNLQAAFGEIISTSDGGFLIAGSLTPERTTNNDPDAMLIKLNADGEVSWARSYNRDVIGIFNAEERISQVVELPNGNFLLVGFIRSFADNYEDALALEVSANGNPERALLISIANSRHDEIANNVVAIDNNTLSVGISTVKDTLSSESIELNILAQLTLDGGINWQHNYFTEPTVGYITNTSSLLRLEDGGYAYLANFAQFFDNLYPILLLTNENGETGCEEPVALSVDPSARFNAISYPLTTVSLEQQVELDLSVTDFDGYDASIPSLDLGPDTTLCEAISLTLDATLEGDFTYLWSTEETSSTITATASGTYFVTARDEARCLTLSDTAIIQLGTLPEITLLADTMDFCQNREAVISAEVTGADSIRWNTGSQALEIAVAEAGAYSLTAFSTCGNAMASIELELPECETTCPLAIPNAFTPNGDSVNDFFVPIGDCRDARNYTFRVFNRWGQLVFESATLGQGWDGSFEGKPAASEVYFWTLSYESPTSGPRKEQGDVTLLR